MWHWSKGQLILKCLLGVFTFFQKTNENKSTSSIYFEFVSPMQFSVEYLRKRNQHFLGSSGFCIVTYSRSPNAGSTWLQKGSFWKMDHCWHQDWSNDSGEMNFKTSQVIYLSQSYYYEFKVVLNSILKFVQILYFLSFPFIMGWSFGLIWNQFLSNTQTLNPKFYLAIVMPGRILH